MNNLTYLEGTNFKGRNFKHDLAPLVAICGANFTGKSARMDAIRFLILGHLPENGKTNESSFELSSGLRMAVRATLASGETIEREMWSDGDSVKSAGTKLDLRTPLMDAAEYFGLTESQRLQYITAHAEITSGAKPDALLESIEKKLSEYPDEVFQSIYTIVQGELEKSGIADGIGKLTDKKTGALSLRFTEWNKKAKDSVGAVRTLTELKNRESECSAETLESLTAAVAAVQAELSAANQEQGKLTEATMAANRSTNRRRELEDILKSPTPSTATLEKLRADLATLKERPALPDGTTLAQMRPAWDAIVESDHKSESDIRELEAVVATVAKRQEELEHQKACPFCKSKGKTWKKTLEETYAAEASAAEADLNAAKESRTAILASRESLWMKMNERETMEKAEAQAKLTESQFTGALAAEGSRIDRITAAVESARKELANLPPAVVDRDALAASATTVANLNGKLANAQQAHRVAIELQHDLRRAAEASEEHEKAKAFVEAITAIGKMLKEVQETNVAETFRKLLESANFYTDGILLTPIAFHKGEVGRFDPTGRFITHRTFSGTEKALTYIAISAALSETGQLRIVLLDELGRVDRLNREKILARLAKAVEIGKIDQAVVIHNEPMTPAGWQVIAL